MPEYSICQIDKFEECPFQNWPVYGDQIKRRGRMNIAVSRAFRVLRVVGARGELERDKILLDISCMNRG